MISGINPLDAISAWPGGIAYVPQKVNLIRGTVRENLVFGYPVNSVKETAILEALNFAGAQDFVESLDGGLNAFIAERGDNLSGGQRQRIGIARAILSKPSILVLDEATSSLDPDNDSIISNSIFELKGQATIIIIAHKLRTIETVDKVLYLKAGGVAAFGSLTEVRRLVPEFEKFCNLDGIE